MSLFLETIRCFKGVFENLPLHQDRLNRSRKHAFGTNEEWNLSRILSVPIDLDPLHVYRCRLVYGEKVEAIEFFPYQIRPIRALHVVEANDLDYGFKYADRTALDALRMGFQPDEEVLIVKNGLITDTTYTNVAFFDGTHWLTPAQPLLEGTRRAALLQAGIIKTADLTPEDLPQLQRIRLFNALMNWDEGPELKMGNGTFQSPIPHRLI